MSFVRCGSAVHFCELRPGLSGGRSSGASPALLLLNALGTNHRIWDGVLGALRFGGPILRSDMRGHGLSEVGDTPYQVESLAADALALLDHFGLESVVVCGLSVGGLVAQELAVSAPTRVKAAVLCGTAARIGTREGWQSRMDQVRASGIVSITDSVMSRWFGPLYRSLEADAVRGYRCMLERTPTEGYLATLHALCEADLSDRVRHVRVPVLVVSGELDQATPPGAGLELAGLFPAARFELLEGASHMMSVEKPRELAGLIDSFLEGLSLEGQAFGGQTVG
jgi:3-oxoadipate enol-lactonase